MAEFFILGKLHVCTRTTTGCTRIRRHAVTEHKKQDPNSRRQVILCMLVYWFCCLSSASLRVCLRLFAYLCARVVNQGIDYRPGGTSDWCIQVTFCCRDNYKLRLVALLADWRDYQVEMFSELVQHKRCSDLGHERHEGPGHEALVTH